MDKWLIELLDKHVDAETGALDKEGFTAEYSTEAPRRVVPKTVFNEKNEELKEARTTLDELKGANNTEELEGKLKEYESKLQVIQEEKKALALQQALTGTVDPEFVSSLIKDKIELDEEGNFKGLEETLNEYKEKRPYLFKQEQKEEEKTIQTNNKKLANPEGSVLTRQDILNIGDRAERLEAIKNNKHLFG